ncbi:MAG: hypothetical protein WD208_03830 [Dehalococcoidia bacterium]
MPQTKIDSTRVPELCPTCSGRLAMVPEPATGGLEAKCLQCGRVAYEEQPQGSTEGLQTTRPAPVEESGEPALEDSSVGRRRRAHNVAPGVSMTEDAASMLSSLLPEEETTQGRAYRLTGTGGSAALSMDSPRPGDVVLRHRGHPVMIIAPVAAEDLGTAVIVVGHRDGKDVLSVERPRQPGARVGRDDDDEIRGEVVRGTRRGRRRLAEAS